MKIPNIKSDAFMSFGGIIMIYGESGAGKSTFASTFPNALFISTEDRLDHISCFRIPEAGCINDLEGLDEVSRLLIREQNNIREKFQYIVIDTVTRIYDMASQRIREKHNLEWLRS